MRRLPPRFTERPKTTSGPEGFDGDAWVQQVPSGGAVVPERAPHWDDEPDMGLHLRFNALEMRELSKHTRMQMTSKQRLVRKIVRNWLRSSRQAKLAVESEQFIERAQSDEREAG